MAAVSPAFGHAAFRHIVARCATAVLARRSWLRWRGKQWVGVLMIAIGRDLHAQPTPQPRAAKWHQADVSSVFPGRESSVALALRRSSQPNGVHSGNVFEDAKPRSASWFAPLMSAVVPGSGQALLGQQRAWGYLAAEGYLLLIRQRASRDADQDQARYRDIAGTIARGGATTIGNWDYYESLEKKIASGAYDLIPGGEVDPETDPSTFNGEQWLLARRNFWQDPDQAPAKSSPEYQRALTLYEQRAYKGSFLWSWRDEGTHLEEYKSTIASYNRSKQRKTNLESVIWANHLANMIDAYITVRVRRYGGAGLGAHVSLRMVPTDDELGRQLVPTFSGSVPFPRRSPK